VIEKSGFYSEKRTVKVPHHGIFTDVVYSSKQGAFFAKMAFFSEVIVLKIEL